MPRNKKRKPIRRKTTAALIGITIEQQTTESVEPTCIDTLTCDIMAAMDNAIEMVKELVAARTAEKLSVSRVAGVGRELRELKKVMSVYETV